MKKLLVFTLAAIMLALCGCGGNGGSSGTLSSPLDNVITPPEKSEETVPYMLLHKITVTQSSYTYVLEHEYDNSGALVKESNIDAESKGITTFTRNEKGDFTKIVTTRNIDHGTGDFPYASTKIFSYDSGRLKNISITDEYVGGDSVHTAYRYRYTDDGKVDYVIIYDNEDNIAEKHIYQYDTDGKIAKRTVDFTDPNAADIEITYEYDEIGRLSLMSYAQGSDAVGRAEYTYSDNGYLSKKVTSGKLLGEAEYVYTYTEKSIAAEKVSVTDAAQAQIIYDPYGIYRGF